MYIQKYIRIADMCLWMGCLFFYLVNGIFVELVDFSGTQHFRSPVLVDVNVSLSQAIVNPFCSSPLAFHTETAAVTIIEQATMQTGSAVSLKPK